MNVVEKVRQECKDRKIPVSKLERDCGFANGYIGSLKKGTIPADRLQTIADYFSVPLGYFIKGSEEVDQYAHDVSSEIALAIRENPILIEMLTSFKDINKEQLLRLKGYYDAMRGILL